MKLIASLIFYTSSADYFSSVIDSGSTTSGSTASKRLQLATVKGDFFWCTLMLYSNIREPRPLKQTNKCLVCTTYPLNIKHGKSSVVNTMSLKSLKETSPFVENLQGQNSEAGSVCGGGGVKVCVNTLKNVLVATFLRNLTTLLKHPRNCGDITTAELEQRGESCDRSCDATMICKY